MRGKAILEAAGDAARSPLTPFVAVIMALYLFRLDPAAPIRPGWEHAMRVLPVNSYFHAAVLLWIYRRETELSGGRYSRL